MEDLSLSLSLSHSFFFFLSLFSALFITRDRAESIPLGIFGISGPELLGASPTAMIAGMFMQRQPSSKKLTQFFSKVAGEMFRGTLQSRHKRMIEPHRQTISSCIASLGPPWHLLLSITVFLHLLSCFSLAENPQPIDRIHFGTLASSFDVSLMTIKFSSQSSLRCILLSLPSSLSFPHAPHLSQTPLPDGGKSGEGFIFIWYRGVFSVVSRWPKSPFWYRDLLFWYRDSAFSCSASTSSSSWDQPVLFFWASTSCKLEVKQISIPNRSSKTFHTTKRHLNTN